MGQTQRVLEMYPHAVPGARPFGILFGQALCFVEDVRVVPIDEYAVHVGLDESGGRDFMAGGWRALVLYVPRTNGSNGHEVPQRGLTGRQRLVARCRRLRRPPAAFQPPRPLQSTTGDTGGNSLAGFNSRRRTSFWRRSSG